MFSDASDKGGARLQIAQHGLIGIAAVAAEDQLPPTSGGALIQTLPEAVDGSHSGQRQSSLLLLFFVCLVDLRRGIFFWFHGRRSEVEAYRQSTRRPRCSRAD